MTSATATPSGPALHAHHIDDEACRVFRAAAEFAGRKWNAAILLALARGATRFSQIEHAVDGISARLLSARLRELEARELVVREVIPTVPVQVTYRLAESGDELIRILHPLVQWAQRQEVSGGSDGQAQ
ncbi:transcriptional regulator [Labedella populi]|uniref:Transcriptional regulator n=1 Tax=Labedella populi TaxID=2498850 RepID=A0A444QED1_9MICO|nr:helix-turn-helix domain-containing protein [Labedella populi]RWZ67932.1 transcriptional regulator [Labedella populi]